MKFYTAIICLVLGLALICDATEKKKKKDEGHHPDTPGHVEHEDEHGEHNPEYDHEAVLGSEDEAEEYSHLNPEIAKERLGQLVDKMDANKDGEVSRQELTMWIQASFKKLDVEDAKKRFNESNKDQDLHVTWAEFLDQTYGYSPEDVKEFGKDKNNEMQEFAELIKKDEEKFNAADANKDNKLSYEEFMGLIHPHSVPEVATVELKHTMADMDKDKDGKLSIREFFGSEPPKDKESELSEAENFKEHDKNGDGFLDQDEVKTWLYPNYETLAIKEAKHLMEKSDMDKDNSLSKQEIVDQHEVFVGSQATDYGNHLKLDKDEL